MKTASNCDTIDTLIYEVCKLNLTLFLDEKRIWKMK